MLLVVSDSSTLIHLARIGRLALLPTFFERITIPPAVWREVDKLRDQGGFWLDDGLYTRALNAAGEQNQP